MRSTAPLAYQGIASLSLQLHFPKLCAQIPEDCLFPPEFQLFQSVVESGGFSRHFTLAPNREWSVECGGYICAVGGKGRAGVEWERAKVVMASSFRIPPAVLLAVRRPNLHANEGRLEVPPQ